MLVLLKIGSLLMLGITYTDPKYSPLQRLKTQLDKVTKFAGNLSSLEETVMEVGPLFLNLLILFMSDIECQICLVTCYLYSVYKAFHQLSLGVII